MKEERVSGNFQLLKEEEKVGNSCQLVKAFDPNLQLHWMKMDMLTKKVVRALNSFFYFSTFFSFSAFFLYHFYILFRFEKEILGPNFYCSTVLIFDSQEWLIIVLISSLQSIVIIKNVCISVCSLSSINVQ